ncbi:hypothetical protein MKW98_015029 [Papaver atlanticum]|uniref:DUF7769 domain-containing protein n=1 Tax=Papaver atlanticum TaxID=357466 RepID=A0AAD4X9F3_9MAGN|nr:hypothetical protein MKW98_015029 [Papaver atlanticum]
MDIGTSFSTRNNKNLTNEQRLLVYHFLLKDSNKGRVKRGSMLRASQLFSISVITAKRIWKRGKDCWSRNVPIDVSSRKPTRSGGKPMEIDLSKLP